jgi:hypothetical protein
VSLHEEAKAKMQPRNRMLQALLQKNQKKLNAGFSVTGELFHLLNGV